MDSPTPSDTKTDELKATLALIRQRKNLGTQVVARNQQLVSGASPAAPRSKIHEDNKDYEVIMNLQDQVYLHIHNDKDANKHFMSFIWDANYIDSYRSIIQKFLSDPTGALTKANRSAARAANKASPKEPAKTKGRPKGSKNKASPSNSTPDQSRTPNKTGDDSSPTTTRNVYPTEVKPKITEGNERFTYGNKGVGD